MIKTNKPIIPRRMVISDGRRQDHVTRAIVWRKQFRSNLQLIKEQIRSWIGNDKLQEIEFINSQFIVRKRRTAANYSMLKKFKIN